MLPAIVFSFDRYLCDKFCQEAARSSPCNLDKDANAAIEAAIPRLEASSPFPIEWQVGRRIASLSMFKESLRKVANG